MLDRGILQTIQDCLYRHNAYVKVYKYAYERLREQAASGNGSVHLLLRYDLQTDCRRYNLPVDMVVQAPQAPLEGSGEIAVILPGTGDQGGGVRDIILQYHAGPLYRISELHPSYLPLSYPLLFPRRESGWHVGMYV